VAESGTVDDDIAELAPADNAGPTVPEGRAAVGLGDRDSTRLARLLLEAGLAKEAAAVYGLIVEQAGPTADLLRSLALARFEAGDVEGGMAASRKVLRLDPRSIPAMHNLALAALERGQLNVAAGWIERGLRVDRHDQGLRRLRMRLYIAWMKRWAMQAVVRK
jgi:tetratricopeptide (TPR) repeat protein